MSNMMIYAQKGAVGGNVESVWGHEMQVCTIDSSNEKAVAAAKASGYSDNPNDIIEQIETQKLEAENKVMKNVLADGADKERADKLEEQLSTALNEIAELEAKLAIYEESKDANGNGKVDYNENTIPELSALLKQRDVEHNVRDGKEALVKLAKDSE